jgi:hypothetical protein
VNKQIYDNNNYGNNMQVGTYNKQRKDIIIRYHQKQDKQVKQRKELIVKLPCLSVAVAVKATKGTPTRWSRNECSCLYSGLHTTERIKIVQQKEQRKTKNKKRTYMS